MCTVTHSAIHVDPVFVQWKQNGNNEPYPRSESCVVWIRTSYFQKFNHSVHKLLYLIKLHVTKMYYYGAP